MSKFPNLDPQTFITMIQNGASLSEVLVPIARELGGDVNVIYDINRTELLKVAYVVALAARADL